MLWIYMVILNDILTIDKKIRYVVKISLVGDFIESVSRNDDDFVVPEHKREKMARHISLLAANHKIMDKFLGKSQMTITFRGEFATILIYTDEFLYSMSIDGADDVESLGRKIFELIKSI